MARKLSSIQRPFPLAISGAYRTTPTAALQILLGIPPLHLQLQGDARMTVFHRLSRQINDIIIQPDDLHRRKVAGQASFQISHSGAPATRGRWQREQPYSAVHGWLKDTEWCGKGLLCHGRWGDHT
ncbi:hypothetical protein AVEN_6269-1 [Araneus ventricosus]|uniref:Uncharacterized protein n=1 Tax=Araneus ventricosus TaxID=182803 RepID=A0A4Y2WY25_ARAVE|nr:hypothetical protein AVEN_6269-1 [Araneus ventricosus]